MWYKLQTASGKMSFAVAASTKLAQRREGVDVAKLIGKVKDDEKGDCHKDERDANQEGLIDHLGRQEDDSKNEQE